MTPCIIFAGTLSDQGYGRVYFGHGKWRRAHVIEWEKVNGPVPIGLQLDHLCRNRGCINLEHLELVTSKENTLRGIGPTAQNARKNFCKRGHALIFENVQIKRGRNRSCRECQKLHDNLYKNKNRILLRRKALAYYYRKSVLAKIGGETSNADK